MHPQKNIHIENFKFLLFMRASFKAIEVKVRQKYELAKSLLSRSWWPSKQWYRGQGLQVRKPFVTVAARTEIFMKNCTEHFLPSLYIISDVRGHAEKRQSDQRWGRRLFKKGWNILWTFWSQKRSSLLTGKGPAWYSPEPSSRLVRVLIFSIYMKWVTTEKCRGRGDILSTFWGLP